MALIGKKLWNSYMWDAIFPQGGDCKPRYGYTSLSLIDVADGWVLLFCLATAVNTIRKGSMDLLSRKMVTF